MESWSAFLARLDSVRASGLLSPVDNPKAYARTAAKSGSSPPEDVDIALLKETARAVRFGMNLTTVRLPGFDVMAETATWFGKLRSHMGANDFRSWLQWASAQVERTGSLADDKLLLHALTQAGTLRPFSEWEAERAVSA